MRLTLGVVTLLAVAGCGDDDSANRLPDAPPTPDGVSVDANTSAVRITVSTSVGPRSNVTVHFQNSDSSLVSTQVTNVDGVAEAVMQPGGYVTAVSPFDDSGGVVRTFAGVKPGDQLVLNRDENDEPREFEVSVPISQLGGSYMLYTSCGSRDVTSGNGSGSGSSQPGGRVVVYGCGASSDLVLEASTGDATEWIYQPAATLANVVDLSALTFATAPTATFNYTNVPAGVTTITLEGRQVTAGGTPVPYYSSADVVAGAASMTAVRSALPNARNLVHSRLFNGSFGLHQLLAWGAPVAVQATDLANQLLAEYATRPELDVASHSVSWTVAPGATPDLQRAEIYLGRGKGGDVNWRIVGPYTNTTLVLPVLPGDSAGYNPRAEDAAYVSELTTVKVVGGYDAVREHALADDLPGGLAASVGASGSAVLQELASPPKAGRAAAPAHKRIRR